MKITHADLDCDDQTKEMILTQVVFYVRNQRLAGIAVNLIKSTSHAQGHQSRHLIPLTLEIILWKFTKADRESDVPLRGKLAKKKWPPDKNYLESFQEEYQKCGRHKQKTGDSDSYCNERQMV